MDDERHEPRTGRVRIIGAEPVGDAEPFADEPFADEPFADEPVPGELEGDTALPHWTEAPTGQVPAVLSGGHDDQPWSSLPEPTWREERTDWAAHEEAFDPSVLAATDEPNADEQERQPWSFDLDAMAETTVVPAVAPRGAHTAKQPDEQLFGDLARPEPFEDEDPWRYDDPVVGTDHLADTGEVEEVSPEPLGAGGEPDRPPSDLVRAQPADRAPDDPAAAAGGAPDDRAVDDPLEPADASMATWFEVEPPMSEPDFPEPPMVEPDFPEEPLAEERAEPARRRLGATARRGSGALLGTAGAAAGAGTTGIAGASALGAASAGGHPGARPGARQQSGGRNVPVAVASGVVLGALALLCFALGTVSSLVVATVVVAFAAVEGYAAFRKAGYRPATLLGLAAVVGVMVGVYNRGEAAEPLVLVLLVVFTLLWHLVRVDKGADPVRSTAATLFVYCWVGVLGSYAALLLSPTVFSHRHGIAYLLGAVITVVAYDVAALGVGSWVGHRPLSAISPNKTWEGLIGGTVVAIVVAVMVVHLIHPWTIGKAAALGVVVAVLAPIGDLAESLVKRHVGLKDMGRLLPGHGGLLDRIDGLLFVLPATYYLVRAFHLG